MTCLKIYPQPADCLQMTVLCTGVVYKTITSPEDAQTLQNDLDRLSEWEDKWHMKFNAKKCFLLRFTGSRSPIETRYNLGGFELEELSSHSFLGVEISHDLK